MPDDIAKAPGPSPTGHDFYRDAWLRQVLDRVKTIAMVGASEHWNRPSYFAMKYLQGKGYRIIPVNPRSQGEEILGERCRSRLAEIEDPLDMVDIFRNSEAAGGIVDEALALPARPPIIWMQLGVRNDEAAARAEAAGIAVVMNRCPKLEWARLHGELSWSGVPSHVISSKRRKLDK
jgi:predicted CoA-binding protein